MTNNHPEFIYRVTITELAYADFDDSTILYEQIVETLDIKLVITAVNSASAETPKAKRAPRSDKGKKRNHELEPVPAQA
jgi:hypothetical protein